MSDDVFFVIHNDMKRGLGILTLIVGGTYLRFS